MSTPKVRVIPTPVSPLQHKYKVAKAMAETAASAAAVVETEQLDIPAVGIPVTTARADKAQQPTDKNNEREDHNRAIDLKYAEERNNGGIRALEPAANEGLRALKIQ